MEKLTMIRLAEMVPDEATAYEYLESLRWKGTPVCPHCKGTNVGYLTPDNGSTRKTRTGAMSARRVWKCRDCKKQFSVLTNTVMHGTKIPVRIWLFVMFEMMASKNGVAAAEVARRYGLCNRSAWHLTQRIREAMGNSGPLAPMVGKIIADETFIGGIEKNRHRQGRHLSDVDRPPYRKPVEKAPVLSLINATTGEVRSRVVPDVTGASLRKAIAENVAMAESTLTTDQWRGYTLIGREFADHQTVDHSHYEYVRYTPGAVISTNQAEGFFSQLKRSLDGTHHHVSHKHLPRYLTEFDFRYTTRDMDDTQRFAEVVGRTDGIRLTYRRLLPR